MRVPGRRAPYELATPAEEGVRKLAVLDFEGGETAAYARLNHYLFGSKAASTYFETRNGKIDAERERKRGSKERERENERTRRRKTRES